LNPDSIDAELKLQHERQRQLYPAIRDQRIEEVQRLIESGASMKDTTNFDPVAEALKAVNEHIILMLLESVADHTGFVYQWLPRAVERINSSCLKFILKHTFPERHPSLQAILDQTLHNELVCMRFEIVTVLFDHGARINPENTTWFCRAAG
jgi:hypothetical protein